MADTARSKSAITTLFADNTIGAISAQDLRDFVESVHPSFGSLYCSASSETSIDVQSTWYKAAGTTTSVNLHRFDMPTDNRLRYTGAPTIHVHAVVSFSSLTAQANKTLEYGAYHYDDSAVSGSILTHSIVQRRHSSADVGTGAIHFDAMLDTNDYLEFHVRNVTDTTNATISHFYVFALGMFL